MAGRGIAIGLAALVLVPALAGGQEPAPDEISRLLFEAYLDGPRKINSDSVMAASVIVADRGRPSGFWRQVLAELKSGDEHSEGHCVRILGNMLATDAAARDAIRRQKETGEVGAWNPTVHLGPEVVSELVARARRADRNRIDHYVIALARARVSEARELFSAVLTARRGVPADAAPGADVPTGFYHMDGPRFHAAVGLAQLGEAAGAQWLIANCEDPNGYVQHARPYFADRTGSIGTCCQAALMQLSEKREPMSKAEWEAWWQAADPSQLKLRAVQFVDP